MRVVSHLLRPAPLSRSWDTSRLVTESVSSWPIVSPKLSPGISVRIDRAEQNDWPQMI